MVEIPAPAHAQPVFWHSIEIPAGNLVIDRNWQGDCQDNDHAQKDRGCATLPPREEGRSPDHEQVQNGQHEADRIPEWHEAPESPCTWLGYANVRLVADRIQ